MNGILSKCTKKKNFTYVPEIFLEDLVLKFIVHGLTIQGRVEEVLGRFLREGPIVRLLKREG